MRVGIHFVNFTLQGAPEAIEPALVETACVADDGGVHVLTLMDHYFQLEMAGTAHDPMLEGYTALGFLAGRTRRVRLGLLVTGVTYRYPGLLAKIVTTLDVLSGGRAQLGLGAAWYEREHAGLGVPFPPPGERLARLEETLQIWSDNDGPFTGRYYQLAETICSPQPLSRPRPRILVGGSGERKTLSLVARYADACNFYATSPAEVAHKIAVLTRHCEAQDRDPATIEKTILAMADPLADPDGFVAQMAEYAALGVATVYVMPGTDPAGFTCEVVERIVPALAELGP
jgi:F420-dependent oxidoreductase-like protein